VIYGDSRSLAGTPPRTSPAVSQVRPVPTSTGPIAAAEAEEDIGRTLVLS